MIRPAPRMVDLTLPIEASAQPPAIRCEKRSIHPKTGRPFVANVYHFQHDSMAGTYLDLPGHIADYDDGSDAANWPLERLLDVPATVIHLDRPGGSGPVDAAQLEAACPPGGPDEALILNALGARRFDEIAPRSVYLAAEAVAWIIECGVRLLVSDVFESNERPQGVFDLLFAAGVATVCQPINLDRLIRPRVHLTVLPLRFPKATQLPCRAVARFEDTADD